MFYQVEYAEKEKEAIKKFKKLFRKEKFSYKNYRRFQNRNSRWNDGDILKQIYTGDWEVKKTLRCGKVLEDYNKNENLTKFRPVM